MADLNLPEKLRIASAIIPVNELRMLSGARAVCDHLEELEAKVLTSKYVKAVQEVSL